MRIRNLIGAVLIAAFFYSCTWFGLQNQADTGLELTLRSKEQIIQAHVIIDSLVTVTKTDSVKVDSLILELNKCLQLKNGNRRAKSF